MNKKVNTLAYFKRQAKKLKKERNITHTEALDVIAKENGYSNWIHCCRSLNEQPVSEIKSTREKFQLSFTDWLKKHTNRDSPLGDLATDALRDKGWPSYSTLQDYRNYLSFKGAVYGAITALERAWKSHKAYLRRKTAPTSTKSKTKKSIIKRPDTRTIVFVSNVTPLHYTKRTIEKFNSGDPAWISWDGRKAIPVTIVEVDDIYYTFRIERPLKKAGNEHYLRLDEVRSTPELACINRVTS
jgi:hypothetical protein